MTEDLMDKVVSLAKRRGFVFPSSEIYGGMANTWDFGHLGVELKNNIKQMWWDRFARARDDIVGIDASVIMNPKVWEASGHLKEFKDRLFECRNCRKRFKADEVKNFKCPSCGFESGLTSEFKDFNLMFQTHFGPVADEKSVAYLRPETAQAMFVNFKNIVDTARLRVPFGIAQIGKAFRNEITPGNFIFRTREFEQMEIEYFIRGAEWKKHFEHWRKEIWAWLEAIGINKRKIHERDVPEGERAHYSERTLDFEYDFPFGRSELYGLAYRGDFDLTSHERASGENLHYRDPESGESFVPHVIEPTWGVERTVLMILVDSYSEEQKGKEQRIILRLKPRLAPYKAAVFPLLSNKEELVKLAREIYADLRQYFLVAWDDRGNIGKRYFSQDEIGTPFCITVDFDSLKRHDVTVRERDTARQARIPVQELKPFIQNAIYR